MAIANRAFKASDIPDKEPQYVKLYLEKPSQKIAHMAPQARAVFFEMIKIMGYDNVVSLPHAIKCKMCVDLGFFTKEFGKDGKPKPRVNSIDQRLKDLVNDKVLLKKGTGLYLVNPTILARGHWGKIRQIGRAEHGLPPLPDDWKERYAKHMRSEKWREFRKVILDARGNKCEDCDETENLHLHHLTYKNLGNEGSQDVMVLCEDCHSKVHGRNVSVPKKSKP